MAKVRPLKGLDILAPTASNARLLIKARLNEMYSFANYVGDPGYVHELHDLRIAAKRLRYTLEVFADYLPANSQEFTQKLARLQDELGALHDSEVMLALLRLSLHKEAEAVPEQMATSGRRTKALLSKALETHMHRETNLAGPADRTQQGLKDFLQRQEQRRSESYTAFRQYWDELEKDHFRESLLKMLAHNEHEEQVSK